jgi:Fe(3+) dicitrate transport protein
MMGDLIFMNISIINPAFSINPNITDEKGYTIDLGIRGRIKKVMSFDLNFFHLSYQNRIGFIQKAFKDGSVKSERGNVGDANLSGLESLIDLNIGELFKMNLKKYSLNSFINYSFIETKYSNSDIQGIKGKKVEFVPKDNLKFGLRYGYKNLTLNIQFSYVSEQFTDSSNAVEGNLSGVIGVIPAYELVDLSGAFKLNKFKLEFGINNTLNDFTVTLTGL